MTTKKTCAQRLQKAFKGFVKFNGYTVAMSCINYAVTRVLDSNVEGGIATVLPWLKHVMVQQQSESSAVYLALFVASIMLFLGIFWECKALLIPFIISYTLVVEEETDGKFLMKRTWQVLFTGYAAGTMLLLLLQGICSCCRRNEDSGKDYESGHHHHSLSTSTSSLPTSRWRRILAFFCCGKCCFRRTTYSQASLNRLDSQSHCSCDTLNVRIAGPNDKHYHRVVFV